ncbi:MAG: tRNA (adenosine(37)-N6)-threonylcarbamoyltransferase complex dimerization subunit type 1 TsaB, partial [Xanthomonadaceae bacterium]|nr:tRNA (adenosine(37)-N6)-threonylcarbamoyltransferase complex dimerization subunit type 1 TsaB [Xanthomonadaceae bacterium]
MNLLAIEAATEACSVGLEVNGAWLQRSSHEPRAHGRLLVPWVEELLAEAGLGFADLDAIAVDRGPGGFTSLRLGLSVAQGIALAHDLPVHPVSSLASLALAACPESGFSGRMLAAIDARMGEIYAGWFDFENGLPILPGREMLVVPGRIEAVGPAVGSGPLHAAGSAFGAYHDVLVRQLGSGLVQI